MARSTAWYPHYPSDWMASTRDLTLEEKGAYRELLDHHFLHESIPADIKRISIILAVSPQKARKLWQVLSRFFHEKDGAFYQKRMVKEIAKAVDISEKRAKAAHKRHHANADANAPANGDTTHNSQLTKNIKHTSRTAARFAEWWDVYDKKVDRKKALAIWKRKNLDKLADTLIADAKNRHDHDDKWRRGYQKNPTTYLNGENWNDEIEQAKSRPSTDPFPKDPNQITAWAQRHGYPEPKRGEEAWQYKQRIGA